MAGGASGGAESGAIDGSSDTTGDGGYSAEAAAAQSAQDSAAYGSGQSSDVEMGSPSGFVTASAPNGVGGQPNGKDQFTENMLHFGDAYELGASFLAGC